MNEEAGLQRCPQAEHRTTGLNQLATHHTEQQLLTKTQQVRSRRWSHSHHVSRKAATKCSYAVVCSTLVLLLVQLIAQDAVCGFPLLGL